ncbi:suppressor of fused domain protein [Lysinibacillus agricola]|uniref:suppressor of fused domain protein n=1 Tax=Lysinibacillus agricola TaxID=2590012 RepID=UPI003C224AE0
MINYGALYFDHYTKFLGEPIDREVYKYSEEMPSIQILKYDNVFEECLVYTTLGLSKYTEIMGDYIEISMVVDGAFKSSGYILANKLFYCVHNQMHIGRGLAISGVENIDAAFVQKYNKSAVYFTELYAFPEEYSIACTDSNEKDGKLMLAFFISQSEYDYFATYGAEKFEDLLEEENVDPFNVSRSSVV